MSTYTEKLMALHDGELTEEQAREVRELLDKQPDGQSSMLMLERADEEFRRAARGMLELPVPQELIDTIRESGGPVIETRKVDNIVAFPRRRAAVNLAVAAGLAAVVVAGIWPSFKTGDDGSSPKGQATYAALLQETLENTPCLLYTSPSPRDRTRSRMPSSA